ncbi:hypothetical protein [Petroclostridium sp. X23]|uniref:hypothetical protein n=1 Tax=Petroclostridium sp. X23 TaxID=3045146 RepID=UPI0024AD1463|nr:hypothetical protein [Petroclostridium sp. X23]WHH58448.1 hypothetical protein QKW49_22045 [Petroclostridium sp. X23]
MKVTLELNSIELIKSIDNGTLRSLVNTSSEEENILKSAPNVINQKEVGVNPIPAVPPNDTNLQSPVPTAPTPIAPTPPVPVSAPVQSAPAQTLAPAAVPTSTQAYTMEQLAVTATQLVDAGRRTDLVGLLNSFGVQALTALPKDQYGAFATKLRELGAKI